MNTAMSNKEVLKQEVREKEGLELTTYLDPDGVSKCIGYGHKLSDAQSPEELVILGLEEDLDDWDGFTIDEDQAECLLSVDIHDAIETLESTKRYPGFTEDELEDLDPQRYIAIIQMAYQMGGNGVRMKYPSFVQAVHDQDWNRAADEMLWSNGLRKQRRSLWHKQTTARCEEMAEKMRYGTKLLREEEPMQPPNTTSASDQKQMKDIHDKLDAIILMLRKKE